MHEKNCRTDARQYIQISYCFIGARTNTCARRCIADLCKSARVSGYVCVGLSTAARISRKSCTLPGIVTSLPARTCPAAEALCTRIVRNRCPRRRQLPRGIRCAEQNVGDGIPRRTPELAHEEHRRNLRDGCEINHTANVQHEYKVFKGRIQYANITHLCLRQPHIHIT